MVSMTVCFAFCGNGNCNEKSWFLMLCVARLWPLNNKNGGIHVETINVKNKYGNVGLNRFVVLNLRNYRFHRLN